MKNMTIAAIQARIAQRSLLTHPFYQAWQSGELSREALADYATQYYFHVDAFPRYLSALHSHTLEPVTRRALLDNLLDEEGGSPNHPELWLQFAEGVGVGRSAVLSAAAEPETMTLVETFHEICRLNSVAAALAALYSYESQIPTVAETKINGLQRFYGITEEKSLAYFRVHQEADIAHSAAELALLECHLSDQDSGDAEAAAQRTLNALWELLSGVCRRHGIGACA